MASDPRPEFVVRSHQENTGALITSVLKKEDMETSELFWGTSLKLPEGETVIKSPIFEVRSAYSTLTSWQIELNPNYVDDEGTRQLSIWLRLLESKRETIVACLNFILKTGTTDPDISRGVDMVSISKDNPRVGFPSFIQMYRLQSNGNPDPNGYFWFSVIMTVFQPVASIDLLEVEAEDVTMKDFFGPLGPIEFNAKVTYEGEEFWVDHRRLSHFSTVFKDNFLEHTSIFDLTPFCVSKRMAILVLKFCHEGNGKVIGSKLDRHQAIVNVLDTADALGIQALKEVTQEHYFKNLKVENFPNAVMLAMEGTILDKEIAIPALMEFKRKNIEVLKNNPDFTQIEETLESYMEQFCHNYLAQTEDDDAINTDQDRDKITEKLAGPPCRYEWDY